MKKHRGLAIVLAEGSHARLHAALTLACGAAALGRPVRLFFHGEAVAALQHDRRWGGDAIYAAAGIPRLAELIDNALQLGVRIMACQSGLHLCGLTPVTLDERIETAGMVAFLADAQDDDLMIG